MDERERERERESMRPALHFINKCVIYNSNWTFLLSAKLHRRRLNRSKSKNSYSKLAGLPQPPVVVVFVFRKRRFERWRRFDSRY